MEFSHLDVLDFMKSNVAFEINGNGMTIYNMVQQVISSHIILYDHLCTEFELKKHVYIKILPKDKKILALPMIEMYNNVVSNYIINASEQYLTDVEEGINITIDLDESSTVLILPRGFILDYFDIYEPSDDWSDALDIGDDSYIVELTEKHILKRLIKNE